MLCYVISTFSLTRVSLTPSRTTWWLSLSVQSLFIVGCSGRSLRFCHLEFDKELWWLVEWKSLASVVMLTIFMLRFFLLLSIYSINHYSLLSVYNFISLIRLFWILSSLIVRKCFERVHTSDAKVVEFLLKLFNFWCPWKNFLHKNWV